MKFDDYEREHYARYAEFAEIIALILQKAIDASDGPRPQSIQHRAKSPKSLRDRLAEIDKLDSDSIENDRRDLAGARLIFYTNTDIDRFLNSRVIFDNFEIERDATRIHHPTKENDERRYRAIHYTVRLKEDRAKLPEYSKFQGMRCEIQIQTILNHAWSETSHDIAYKNKPRAGFGTKAMRAINNRFNRIMDKYLLPAGYEFQRVQHDYERLQQGKELFDQDILGAIQAASDNNDRFELLTSLKDDVLPNYDDVPAVYRDLVDPLMAVVSNARTTAPLPIKTTFGELEGKTTADVTQVVIEIFELLRYVDIERTFQAFCQIFRNEPDERVRKAILDAVLRLADYDLEVWEQAGSAVQAILVDSVEKLGAEDQDAVRPIIVAVWEAALKSDINGTTWKANSVTLSSAALPVSPAVKSVRDKAITGLFSLFKRSTSDDQRREVISALGEATRPSPRAQYSNDLLALTMADAHRIVEFFADNAEALSYELRESMEYNYLFDYHRAREIAEDEADRFGCRDVANALMESIRKFRDRINADQTYTRYKTLVGFETVLPEHWDDEDRDHRKVEEFRTAEAERFVRDISPNNETEWFLFIERCAATKSDDGATFPIFRKFLMSLAQNKPDAAKRLLARANPDLLSFLPALLDGLLQGSESIWQDLIDEYLADGAHLTSIALHWRESKPPKPGLIQAVLERAITSDDNIAVIQCVLFAIESGPGETVPPNDQFFKPAISYLTRRKNARWVVGAWFADDALPFFEAMTEDEAKLLLDNLVEAPRIAYQVERMLSQIARRYLSLVYDYFGQRLGRPIERGATPRYEAVPYRFHGLERELSKDPGLAVSTVRRWYAEEQTLFRFNGGRVLSAAFPRFQPELSDALCELVTHGTEADADFVLAVMANYHGEAATHEVLKRIVEKYPEDEDKVSGVRSSFDSTGVVTGEFGFAEAMRSKKTEIEPWLADPRPAVQTFAGEHIRYLDLRIADEQRRAEQEKRLRDLRYEDGEDGED